MQIARLPGVGVKYRDVFFGNRGDINKRLGHAEVPPLARLLLHLETHLEAFLVGSEFHKDSIDGQAVHRLAVEADDPVTAFQPCVPGRRSRIHIRNLVIEGMLVYIHDSPAAKAEQEGLAGKHHVRLSGGGPVAESPVMRLRLPAQFVQQAVDRVVLLDLQGVVSDLHFGLIVEVIPGLHQVENFSARGGIAAGRGREPFLVQRKRPGRIGGSRGRNGHFQFAVGTAVQAVSNHDLAAIRAVFAAFDVGPVGTVRQAGAPRHGCVAGVTHLQGNAASLPVQIRTRRRYFQNRRRFRLPDRYGARTRSAGGNRHLKFARGARVGVDFNLDRSGIAAAGAAGDARPCHAVGYGGAPAQRAAAAIGHIHGHALTRCFGVDTRRGNADARRRRRRPIRAGTGAPAGRGKHGSSNGNDLYPARTTTKTINSSHDH